MAALDVPAVRLYPWQCELKGELSEPWQRQHRTPRQGLHGARSYAHLLAGHNAFVSVRPKVEVPILGEASELAAKAALASKAQGKHQVFHEALLASKGEMTKESILAIARDVGLDTARLEADMHNPEWQKVIDANRALARTLGISGTPGFIVGTELVPGALDLNGLKELIARAGSRP